MRKKVMSLGEALPMELARVRKMKALYESLEGGAGMLAAMMMEASLQAADKAIIEGDVVGMIRCYEDLKGYTD